MRLVCRSIIYGEPTAYMRVVRDRAGRAHKPAKMKAAQNEIAWQVKADNVGMELASGPVGIDLAFYSAVIRQDRMKDIDNLIKLALDSLNTIAWQDDRQVVELRARLDRGAAEPRTEIAVYALED